jgi:hypothetical protein
MIQLVDKALSTAALTHLASYQAQIDAKSTYKEQVDEAKR